MRPNRLRQKLNAGEPTVLSDLAPRTGFAGRGGAGRLPGGSGLGTRMDCVACGSADVTERPERTAQGLPPVPLPQSRQRNRR